MEVGLEWLIFSCAGCCGADDGLLHHAPDHDDLLGQAAHRGAGPCPRELPGGWWRPLVLLAIFAVVFGWLGIPDNFLGLNLGDINWIHHFVTIRVAGTSCTHETIPFSFIPLLTSLVVALGGLYLGYRTYKDKLATPETPDPVSVRLGRLFTHMNRKWYFDELYDKVFVRPTKTVRRMGLQFH